jgi:hypothetical protein
VSDCLPLPYLNTDIPEPIYFKTVRQECKAGVVHAWSDLDAGVRIYWISYDNFLLNMPKPYPRLKIRNPAAEFLELVAKFLCLFLVMCHLQVLPRLACVNL